MKPLLIFAIAVPMLAQQVVAPQTPVPVVAAAASSVPAAAAADAPPAKDAAPAAKDASAPAADPAPAPSPKPSAEEWVTGYVEFGYQGLTGVGGSLETYRSVVNLGSGLKLLDTDFTILDPKHRLFERLRVRADHWGDDPFSSLHVFVEKRGIYKILADVRRLSYFNDLPSYADPTKGYGGAALDQQSFDVRRHIGTYDLELFNNHLISPYLQYEHDGSSGQGVTVFETNADQFAVPYTSSDSTELYRAGTHITGSHFHITLEAGGTTYKNNQNTYTYTSQAPNPGDNTVPVFGYTQGLSSLLDAYGIRGSSVFSRAVFTATPFKWLDVYGHFEYSEPKSTLNYQQYNSGAFVLESQVLLYNSEQYLIGSAAKQPHTTGNIGVEIRPLQHIRLLESWSTDRLHDAGSATQNDTLVSTSGNTLITDALAATLATNYSQAETTIIADATNTVTLRAGYKYVWGNASDLVLPGTEGLPGVIAENLRRNVFTGAITWRPSEKLSLTGEVESGSSSGAYFRTSLYNYTRARGLGRYQLFKTLRASFDYTVLSNNNPNAGSPYLFFSHQETASVDWTPKGDKYTFDGSYSHCSFHSEIDYLNPGFLTAALSDYRENCHSISGYINAKLKGFTKGQTIQLAAGGAAVLTAGSRPTNYYQPTARLVVPMTKRVGLFGEWRYYGLGEAYYGYESFRAHLLTVGLRYTR